MDREHLNPAAISSAVPHFYGREEELDWLYALFEDVVKTGVPRLAVILAESGIGKSALVQALYRKLTTDRSWDGPGGYWPDAFQGRGDEFQGRGDNLKVNPDFPKNYRPGEPPKFMWIGIRWQDPGNRNRDDQSCPLPKAREDLYRHAQVVRGMLPLWKGILDRLKKQSSAIGKGVSEEVVTTGTEALAGIAVGPLALVVKPGFEATRDAIRGKGLQHRDVEEATKQNAGDELCRELGGLMSGKKPLPTIVWLDDAHWIDASSIAFLEKLFRLAKSGKWPLLVIATHWEREWNEHREHGGEGGPSLTRFANLEFDGTRRTETRALKKGDQEALRKRLLDRLSGLTVKQQGLIIQKSDGNFLSLEENIGELRDERFNFENGDLTKPLTQSAVDEIEEWESRRDIRVKQRFRSLEDDIRRLLGWSGRAGVRFIGKLIADFAQGRIETEPEEQISRCIYPYAILSASEGDSVLQFRDRAYHRSAMQFFKLHLQASDEDALRRFLADRFSDWVNRCFDDNGQTLVPEDAPESSLLAASSVERVKLLEIIIKWLPMKNEPDWSGEIDAAGLRAHWMLVEAYSRVRLWDQCRRVAKSLEKTDWMAVPMTLLCFDLREDACSYLMTAGALEVAGRLAGSLLSDSRNRFEVLSTRGSLRDVRVSLIQLGRIEVERGKLDRARKRFSDAVDVDRRLVKDRDTPRSHEDLCASLRRLGGVEVSLGKLDRAYERYSEQLDIARRLVEDRDRSEGLRSVSRSLRHLGDIDVTLGKLDRAHERCSEALEVARRLPDNLSTPENLWAVSFSLDSLGRVEVKRGKLDGAYKRYSEALAIARRLAKELGTPESRRDVCASLCRLGGTEVKRGKLDGAYKRYSEALEIARRLAEELGTPRNHQSVSRSLRGLGVVEEQRGKLDRAYERYSEALEIARRMADELGSPRSRKYVRASLDGLSDVEEQRGKLDRAHELCSEALKIARRLAEDPGTPESQQAVRGSLCRLGDIEVKRGKLDRAYERYSEALKVARRLAEDLDTPGGLRDVYVSLVRLGGVEVEQGKVERARKRYSEALKIARRLAEDSGARGSLWDVYVSLARLGGIEVERGELERARELYSEALEKARRLDEDSGARGSLPNVYVSLDRLGGIEVERGELDRAYERCWEGLETARQLAADLGAPGNLRDMYASLDPLGGVEVERG